jgi:osmotically-inducible protein OsmY
MMIFATPAFPRALRKILLMTVSVGAASALACSGSRDMNASTTDVASLTEGAKSAHGESRLAAHERATSMSLHEDAESDRQLEERLRERLLADSNLSLRAKHVRILVKHGVVTLRGSVQSVQEAQSVREKAMSEADASSLVDDLEVASPRSWLE